MFLKIDIVENSAEKIISQTEETENDIFKKTIKKEEVDDDTIYLTTIYYEKSSIVSTEMVNNENENIDSEETDGTSENIITQTITTTTEQIITTVDMEYHSATIDIFNFSYTFKLTLHKKIGNDVEGNILYDDALFEVVFKKNAQRKVKTYSVSPSAKTTTQIIITKIIDNGDPEIIKDETSGPIINKGVTTITTTYSYVINTDDYEKVSWIYK